MSIRTLFLFIAAIFALNCCIFLGSCKNKNEVTINPDSIVTITLEIPVDDILRELAGMGNEMVDSAFEDAIKNTDLNSKNHIAEFCDNYKKNGGDVRRLFNRQIQKIKDNPLSNDVEIQGYIEEEVNNIIENCLIVLRERLDKIGVSKFKIETSSKPNIITITMPNVDNTNDMDRIISLLCKKGNFEIYETYKYSWIANQLLELSDKQSSTTSKQCLMRMLANNNPNNCIAGLVPQSDTASVNRIINSPLAKEILPSDLKLCWTVKAEKADKGPKRFALVALKLKKTTDGSYGPVLSGDIVSNTLVKDNCVKITFNDYGSIKFSHITLENLGRNITFVLDDQVFFYPSIAGQITGGSSEITGDYTEKEFFDLGILIECGALRVKPNIVSKIIKEK